MWEVKKKTNSQACCYITFKVLHNTSIHHFEKSVIYVIEICILSLCVVFLLHFCFLLGTCLNEHYDKRSRTWERPCPQIIHWTCAHLQTVEYDTGKFKCCIMLYISYFKMFQCLKPSTLRYINNWSIYHIDVSSYLSL